MKIEWRKSSRSGGGQGGGGGDCVELADLSSAIGIRDSKAPEQGRLELARDEMAGLFGKIKSGKFDL